MVVVLCYICFLSHSHTQMPIVPKWPAFLEYISPQAATFPVFLVFFFAFAASQDNHFPLKFVKASQTLLPTLSLLCSNNPSLPKTPLGKRLVFCLASFQFKRCLTPCHKECIWRSRAQCWLCLLPTCSALWPILLGSSSIPAAHHGRGLDGKEIAQQDHISQIYHLSWRHRRPAWITTPKYFLLGHGQYSLKQEKQTARSLPSGPLREERSPYHRAAAGARWHHPHRSLNRSRHFALPVCLGLEQRQGRESRVTSRRETGKLGGPFRESYSRRHSGIAHVLSLQAEAELPLILEIVSFLLSR